MCGILGRGATAAVSLAQHVSGQMVALKARGRSETAPSRLGRPFPRTRVVLTPHAPPAPQLIPLDCREAARARLLAELRCTHAAADCASVVALHAAFLVDGCVAVVLEYMDRGSLADVLLRVGSLPEPVRDAFRTPAPARENFQTSNLFLISALSQALAAVAGAVCAGLVHLHDSLRILHRDVKPGNVLLDSTGRVKLSDFGVSGSMDADSTSSSWLGTARYMAPERIGGGRYGAASDVWALGLTLLEAATGRWPFASAAGSDFWTVLDEVTSSPPPRLPNDGRFTPGFRDFVSRCLEADPAMRPTAAQLLDHPWLRSATAGGAAEAALVGVVAGLPPAGGLPTLPE